MWLKLKLWIANPAKNLWVQPTMGALFALFFSVLASFSHLFIPERWIIDIKAETLLDLIEIISGSMLAVTTFSLSIMVSALSATSSSTTPRARLLVMSDPYARLAITSFISAFIYSVIAKITLGLQYYGTSGRFVMFVGTLLVLAYLIITLIRWVQTLSNIGSLSDTLQKIDVITKENLEHYRQHPNHGINGQRPTTEPLHIIYAAATGYLFHMEFQTLNNWCEQSAAHIHIVNPINALISKDNVLFEIFAETDSPLQQNSKEDWRIAEQELGTMVAIQADPSYQQDPVSGIQMLAEVAHRALSAAVNDPGTAIRTVSMITSLLTDTQAKEGEENDYPLLSICSRSAAMFSSVFYPLARDGVSSLEFITHTLRCMSILHRNAPEAELRESVVVEAAKIYLLARQSNSHTQDQFILDNVWKETFPDWQQ